MKRYPFSKSEEHRATFYFILSSNCGLSEPCLRMLFFRFFFQVREVNDKLFVVRQPSIIDSNRDHLLYIVIFPPRGVPESTRCVPIRGVPELTLRVLLCFFCVPGPKSERQPVRGAGLHPSLRRQVQLGSVRPRGAACAALLHAGRHRIK